MVTQYANQIKGLNLQQAQLALSTKILTNEQKEQILAQAGLIASENIIQSELLESTLKEFGLSESKKMHILSILGLTNAEGTEVLAEKTCTKEKLKAILAQELKNDVDTEAILKTLGVGNANIWTADTFKLLGKSIKQAFVALMTNPYTYLIAGLVGVVTVVKKTSEAIDEVRDKAQELGDTFNTSKSEIEGYKSQIEDLYKTINDSDSSVEDITSARQTLMSVQDELIDKFGDEKETIDLVTQAINGQSSALDDLIDKQWQETKNKFNESGFWNDYANWTEGYSDNIDRMVNDMENAWGNIKMSTSDYFGGEYDDVIKRLEDAGWKYSSNSETFVKGGSVEDLYEEILEIQALVGEDMPDNFLKSLTKDANELKGTLDKYEDIWDNYILNDKILADENIADSWKEVNDAYTKYQKAVASGDKNAIEEATAGFATSINEVLNNENVDDSVKDYFKDMYPVLYREVEKWEFKTNIIPKLDTSGLQGKTQADILGMLQTDGAQAGEDVFNSIVESAIEYGLIVNDDAEGVQKVLDLLVEWGILQGTISDNAPDVNKMTVSMESLKKSFEAVETAISEYNKTGYLSVETFEKLMELEPKYLNMLIDENGDLNLNTEAVQANTSAYIENMGIKAAQNLIDTVSGMKGATEQLKYLTGVTNENTKATWANIYTQLARAKAVSDPAVMDALISRIDAIKAMTEAAKAGIGKGGLGKNSDKKELNAFKNRIDKITQSLSEYTKQLELLKQAQDDLYEDDYIGKLDYINRRYEVHSQYTADAKKELDSLLQTIPTTADGWNELASAVENVSEKYFEGKRALIDYQVEMSQAYMDALKATSELSNSVLDESLSQYDRNVKMLTEGGLGGLQFSLTPVVPQDAVEKQREENEKLLKEEEIYQEKVNQIKRRALDEQLKASNETTAVIEGNVEDSINGLKDEAINAYEETKGEIEKNPIKIRLDKSELLDLWDVSGSRGSSGNAIVDEAKRHLGTPYMWGGATPAGFDCSGLVKYVLNQVGKTVPRVASDQYKQGSPVAKNALKEGDVVFFTGSDGTATNPGHVGIYIGDGKYIHAPQTGDVVKIADLGSRKDYVGARRYATGTKDYGVAGENYKKEFLIDKKTGQWTEVNSPTLIDTNEVDVVGEKASAKIDKPLPMYANGTLDFGNLDVISQMPKLGNDQIEHILRTKFKNSPLITDSNIASVVDGISKAQAQSGISALVILSIAGWESGWGTSAIAKQKGNFWGWGAYDSDPMGTAVTFNSDIGQAAQDYANKLKATYYDGYGFKTLNQMSNGKGSDHLYAYAAQSSKWGANNSQIIKELVTGLENSGLTDFTADIASSAATTASNTTSIRRSFDSQFRDFIEGANGVSSSSSVEDSLMNYIKANTEISTDSTEKFIEAFEGLNAYKDFMEPYFNEKREEVRNAAGTPEFAALTNAYNKEHSGYIETIMGYSTDMTVAQAKAQYKLSEDAIKAGYKYYNERKNAGASATELMEIATKLGEMEKVAEEYSDAYVQAISAETDFFVSRTERTLNAFDNEMSWLDKDLEKAEGDTAKQAEIYGKKNDVSKRAMDAAHQRALDIQQDEDYADIFSTYDVESWFDANGELTSKFYEDVEGASSELIPYMNQLAKVLGVCKKDWYENAEAIEDNNEAMADLKIEEYIKYQERLVEALDFDATLSQSLSTAKEGMYNIFKTLRDERAEMEKELKANMQIDDWLTEDTRKLLFNLDDYEEQMGVINNIQADAEQLYINYQNELAGLKEDELYKEEEITAEYNRQLEKLQDRLSIAKADLQLAKDKAAFENALRERDTQIIMGNRVQNVADPERLRDAAMKMAESESNLENEKTTSAENQDIRNMEATTGMINQERGAIQNRIDMINGMTEAERRALADFIEPIEIINTKLTAISKVNPERIIRGDNSDDVVSSLDLSKRDGWSLTEDHSGMVEMIQNLIDNGYYKKGTPEYDLALQLQEWIKWQHDNKTTSDAHNYGYSLYDADNAYLWGKGAMKMFSDDVFRVMSQHWAPIEEYISSLASPLVDSIKENSKVIEHNGQKLIATTDENGNTTLTNMSFLEGYEELSGADMIKNTLGYDDDKANAIYQSLVSGAIAPSMDMYKDLAKMGVMWNIASGTTGNTDNSINMQEAHFHITEPVQDANGVMTHFVRKLEMERSTTNNQR